MKPLHIGLLVVGAALAGGLAMKMTEPLPIPQAPPALAPVAPPVTHPINQPSPPAAVIPAQLKPSPIPARFLAKAAAAPEPIYDEPSKPAIRKNKPISMASAKPVQWTPIPYKAPSQPTPASVPAPAGQTAIPEPAPPSAPSSVPPSLPFAPRQVTLRTGMTVPVRLDESLSSGKDAVGDTFQASLAEPLVVDGLVIAEKGARVAGRITNSRQAGRVELRLTNLATSDGQRVAIFTDPWTKQNGTQVNVPPETVIRFRLTSRVTITEQQIAGR